ncbi:MAG: DUF6691 family protein [Pseudomonadota bacterium]
MARKLVALASGALFGVGLVVADMINAARVQAFLDPLGAWDPTLAFVMGGAMSPMAVAWAMSRARRPAFAARFPAAPGAVDGRLVSGAALFGAGWGLAGFCPGPALAAISFGGWPVAIFVAAMAAGMAIYDRALAPPSDASAAT